MKSKIIAISVIALLLLCGCENSDIHNIQYPKIQECGRENSNFDNCCIEVLKAKPGLKGYEIIETNDGIDVILHYDKREENNQ